MWFTLAPVARIERAVGSNRAPVAGFIDWQVRDAAAKLRAAQRFTPDPPYCGIQGTRIPAALGCGVRPRLIIRRGHRRRCVLGTLAAGGFVPPIGSTLGCCFLFMAYTS